MVRTSVQDAGENKSNGLPAEYRWKHHRQRHLVTSQVQGFDNFQRDYITAVYFEAENFLQIPCRSQGDCKTFSAAIMRGRNGVESVDRSILVTGGFGFIGSHLVEVLLKLSDNH